MKTFQKYESTVRRHNRTVSHKRELYRRVKLTKLTKFLSIKEREHRLPPDSNCIASTYTWGTLTGCLAREVMLHTKDYIEGSCLTLNNGQDLSDRLSPCSSRISAEPHQSQLAYPVGNHVFVAFLCIPGTLR